jgi:drug/metabolite transporter (DMT)-like permease
MSTRWLFLTLLCVVLIAVGQLLFKAAAGQWRIDGWSWATLRSFLSPTLLLALVLYGLTTVLWVLVLRSAPLSIAYPLYALVFLLVPILAHFVFGEPLSWNSLVGGAVIMLGVMIAIR